MPGLSVKPTLIIDTREKAPYEFQRHRDKFADIRTGTLKAGDYSLLGYDLHIAIERKSLQDLVNTIFHNRDRFKRELARLNTFNFAAVIVEATMQEVCSPYTFSQGNPASIIGSIESFSMQYGVHFIFAGNRILAEDRVSGLLQKFFFAMQSERV